MTDLIAAARKQLGYARNEFASGDATKGGEHLDKADGFLSRLTVGDAIRLHGDAEPLSTDVGTAIAQIRAAIGHPIEFNDEGDVKAVEPSALIGSSSPEQLQQLALLGVFGPIGTRSDVDYSLREQFYRVDEHGQEVIASDTPETLTSISPWQSYLEGKASA